VGESGSADRRGGARDIPGGVHRGAGGDLAADAAAGCRVAGCELVYGLVAKEGTLKAMARAIEAGKAQKRTEAWARKLQKAKDQRRDAAKQRWRAHEKERLARQWREYWKQLGLSTPMARRRMKEPVPED